MIGFILFFTGVFVGGAVALLLLIWLIAVAVRAAVGRALW